MIYVYMAAGEMPLYLNVDSEDRAIEKGKHMFTSDAENIPMEDLPKGFWILMYTDEHIGVSARFYTAVETPRSFSFR